MSDIFPSVPETMSKRELFAGLAMLALIATPHAPDEYWDAEDSMEWCVEQADALIAKLEKPTPEETPQ